MRGGIALPAPTAAPRSRWATPRPASTARCSRSAPRTRSSTDVAGFTARRRRPLPGHLEGRERRPARCGWTSRPARPRCWPQDRSTTSPTSRSTRPRTRVQVVSFMRERVEHVVLDAALARRRRRRCARCTPATCTSAAATTPTASGCSASPPTTARSPTTPSTARAARGTFLFTHKPDLAGVHAGGDGAVRVHVPRRPRGARLPHLPARLRPHAGCRPCSSSTAARGRATTWGFDPDAAVARQPRLPVRPGQLPRLDRLRQGVPERRRPRVGRAHARRPARRGRPGSSSRATPTRTGSRSTAAPTAATPRSSAPRSRRTRSAARSTSSARPTCAR